MTYRVLRGARVPGAPRRPSGVPPSSRHVRLSHGMALAVRSAAAPMGAVGSRGRSGPARARHDEKSRRPRVSCRRPARARGSPGAAARGHAKAGARNWDDHPLRIPPAWGADPEFPAELAERLQARRTPRHDPPRFPPDGRAEPRAGRSPPIRRDETGRPQDREYLSPARDRVLARPWPRVLPSSPPCTAQRGRSAQCFRCPVRLAQF